MVFEMERKTLIVLLVIVFGIIPLSFLIVWLMNKYSNPKKTQNQKDGMAIESKQRDKNKSEPSKANFFFTKTVY